MAVTSSSQHFSCRLKTSQAGEKHNTLVLPKAGDLCRDLSLLRKTALFVLQLDPERSPERRWSSYKQRRVQAAPGANTIRSISGSVHHGFRLHVSPTRWSTGLRTSPSGNQIANQPCSATRSSHIRAACFARCKSRGCPFRKNVVPGPRKNWTCCYRQTCLAGLGRC